MPYHVIAYFEFTAFVLITVVFLIGMVLLAVEDVLDRWKRLLKKYWKRLKK